MKPLDALHDQGIAPPGRSSGASCRAAASAKPSPPEAVRQIDKRRCALAGLDTSEFSAHSLRAGFLTEAGRHGVPLKAAMDRSGHASVATAMGYMRAGALGDSPATRLLDADAE